MGDQAAYSVALDIGGSHVSGAVVDLAARDVLPNTNRRREINSNDQAEVILDAWAQVALDAARSSGVLVSAVGIAMPDPFDYEAGISLMEHKYEALNGLNVVELLEARWRDSLLDTARVLVANDAHLFALGEWWAGAARGSRRMIGLTLGTGLGSGFIENGRIITSGPEVPEGGVIWNTPYLDSIAEDYAAGGAIERSYQREAGQVLSVAEIARRAAENDSKAREAFSEMGRHLVRILDPYVRAFRPEYIVVGGNISRAWPLFGPQLQSAWPGVKSVPSERLEDATLLGAAFYTQPS